MVNAVQCMPLAWHSWWQWWWYHHGMDDGIGYADEKFKKREVDPRLLSAHPCFLPSIHHVPTSSCSMQCIMPWHSPQWWCYHDIHDIIAYDDDDDECNRMYSMTFHAIASHLLSYHGNHHYMLWHHVCHHITITIMENSMARACIAGALTAKMQLQDWRTDERTDGQ